MKNRINRVAGLFLAFAIVSTVSIGAGMAGHTSVTGSTSSACKEMDRGGAHPQVAWKKVVKKIIRRDA